MERGVKMGIEFQILDWIQSTRSPEGDVLMCFFSKLGNAGMLWIAAAVVLVIIPRTRKTGIIMMAALIIDLILCNGILKNLIGRVRL